MTSSPRPWRIDALNSLSHPDDPKRNYLDAHRCSVGTPDSGCLPGVQATEELFKLILCDCNSPADCKLPGACLRVRDVAISLGQDWFLNLLLCWIWYSTRIGYKDAGKRFFLTKLSLLKKSQQYTAHMYFHDLLQALGINSPVQS